MAERYDLIIVGTGFAGAFFLQRYLEKGPKAARVLVLERGRDDSKAWQLQNRRTSSIDPDDVFINATPKTHAWITSPGFGGNSKCWFAAAMRLMPNDLKLKSTYGVGIDWPLSYDDIEPYYDTVEQIMMVSGPQDSPMPRSRPFPLPPHRLSTPDELLKRKFPDQWFHPATARASAATGQRGVCCASGICSLCPVDAKFTIQNGLAQIFRDPRVTLQLEAPVEAVDIQAGVARGVRYTQAGAGQQATADVVVLAASALFNPHILMRSGMSHRLLGRRLHEQLSMSVCVDLDGVKAYDGSTIISGNGYLFYDGEHRRDYAACLVETWTTPFSNQKAALRAEQGRWNERQYFEFIFDELPLDENRVSVHEQNPRLAETTFIGYSDYARRGAARIPQMLDKLSEALPIERTISVHETLTLGHLQGTTVMGTSAEDSIVDRNLVHHQVRNLLVLGAGAFPTASPAGPTLTVSAMALRSADQLLS